MTSAFGGQRSIQLSYGSTSPAAHRIVTFAIGQGSRQSKGEVGAAVQGAGSWLNMAALSSLACFPRKECRPCPETCPRAG